MDHTEFFSQFFVVRDPATKRNYRGNIKNDIGEFGRLLRAENKIDHLDIEYLEGGNEPGSLFWNRVNEPFCISQALVDLLVQNELKGWSAIPVTVTNKLGNIAVDEYFALTISGRTNPIDYLKTGILFKQMPGGKIPHFKGLYFDPGSWDGSDIFMCKADANGKYTGSIYVTRRFAGIFKANKIPNIEFINFNDFELSCFTVQIGATAEMKKKLEEKIKKASL